MGAPPIEQPRRACKSTFMFNLVLHPFPKVGDTCLPVPNGSGATAHQPPARATRTTALANSTCVCAAVSYHWTFFNRKSIQPVDPVAAVQNSKWVGSTRYGGAQKFVPRPTARYAIISFEVTQGHEVCMRGTYCPQMPFRRPATAVPTYSAHYQWTLDRGSNFLSNRTSTAKNVHSKTVRQLTI